ncbi:MAG: regulatory protein RecX [Clostridiaceae bacterium]|jgi:SOS response regulatory protein OraA/RecX|nr:regulatory protein RecX [Clostridiaceae bacterium]
MKKISSDLKIEGLSDEERALRRRLQDARSEAISFLGLAKKPSGRVAQRLRDEGYDDDIVREVVRELTEEGYLDDLAIACRMTRQRRGRQAESRFALRQRLLQSGLERSAVDAALDETLTDRELARDLLDARFAPELKHLRSDETPPGEKRRLFMRVARLLSSRGFDSELINELIRRH